MRTLSASSSVFQLAFAVNAVLPVVIADFEKVRKEAADSLLRKIKEYRPEFDLRSDAGITTRPFSLTRVRMDRMCVKA
jgi:hypothetical protein